MRVLARRRVRWAALLAIVGAMALGGVAYATIPDSNGVIHTCYMKSGGALRVIDNSVTKCKSSETALPISQTGPPGQDGADGAPGAPGLSLFARVRGDDGGLVGGTAVGASRLQTGTYDVTFPQDVSTCAAVAMSGSFVGFDGAVFRAIGHTSVGFGNPNQVQVDFFNDQGNVDTSFHLIVAC